MTATIPPPATDNPLAAMEWVVGRCSGSTVEIIGTSPDGLRCKSKWRFVRPRNWSPLRREIRNRQLAEKLVDWVKEHGFGALHGPDADGLLERLAGDNSPDAPAVMRAP